MRTADDLAKILQRIDGQGYKAYRDIRGAYEFDGFQLFVDHVQADPFAAPSHMRARVPMRVAGLPEALREGRVRRMALADFLAREIAYALAEALRGGRRSGSGNSGTVQIDAGGQSVLERSAVRIGDDFVEARFQLGLPAGGRRIQGRGASELLLHLLPPALCRGLLWSELPQRAATRFVESIENQESLRDRLDELGLVAFVANGSLLPRRREPTTCRCRATPWCPFRSPAAFEVTVEVPNAIDTPGGPRREITGMGIPKGVTLIVGGGYHGKSTLLQALERCVYPHVPGDGREGVVCARDAVKVRAEDGRFVGDVDIRAFIGELPGGVDTRRFSTADASGSTSQASNIVEAVEVGARTLLLDEDTSATNFMVRDARMRKLIRNRDEPITPFIDRVRELHQNHGISTVLVMGGVGDYFAVADHVIAMRDYCALDVTAEARRIAENEGDMGDLEHGPEQMRPATRRVPLGESFDSSRGRRPVKIDARGLDMLLYGTEPIDLRCVAQLEDRSQTLAVGYAMHVAAQQFMDGRRDLSEVLDCVEAFLDENGVDSLSPFRRGEEHPGNFARPRRFEIAAAINRIRSLRVR